MPGVPEPHWTPGRSCQPPEDHKFKISLGQLLELQACAAATSLTSQSYDFLGLGLQAFWESGCPKNCGVTGLVPSLLGTGDFLGIRNKLAITGLFGISQVCGK